MTSRIFFLVCSFVGLAMMSGLRAAEDTKRSVPAERPSKSSGAKTALAKGMTAEQVQAIVGKPNEIRPIKNSKAKAETWVYRRLIEQRTEQTATGVEIRPAFVGLGVQGDGTVTVPATRLERITTYQITWVLMIDGRMEMAKQTREVARSFD